MTECPLECLTFCEETFIQAHETFILTVIASGSTLLGMVFAYLLKSRCSKIKCFGLSCDRTPIPIDEMMNTTVSSV